MSRYEYGQESDLIAQIVQLKERVKALESGNRIGFTGLDVGNLIVREGNFRVIDDLGNTVVELGKSISDGFYGLRVLDNAGATQVQAGEVGTDFEGKAKYGFAAVNETGQLVTLSQLAFGLIAASDSGSGTRSTTLPIGFDDLAGANVGPSVEVSIGDTGKALCFFSADIEFDPSLASFMHGNASVEVSGASTVAASLSYAVTRRVSRVGADAVHTLDAIQSACMHVFTGLTPGLNTFTMKYRADATFQALTVTFKEREIAVFPY